MLQWVSEKCEESESSEEEYGSEWDLGDSVGGSDLDGGDDVTSPTWSEVDSALIAFTGGESSELTHPKMMAITVGGDGKPKNFEALPLMKEGSDGYPGGVETGHEDLEVIKVEPLAMVIPPGVDGSVSEVNTSMGGQPSDWVMRKEKGVGKILGANYEGYEQAVIELLMDIEARHIQRKAAMVGIRRHTSLGKKCSRELKGLVSSVNYEARHSKEAKGKGKASGGDVVVS